MSGEKTSETRDTPPRRERVRREEPEQTEPIRDWRGWFQSASWDRPMETVDRGVKMAYRVVEDYIEQGRRVAQQMNDRTYGPREMTDDFQSLSQRMVRDSSRFLSLWFELVTSTWGMGWRGWETARSGPGRRERSASRPGRDTSADTAAPESTGRAAVTLEVRSSHLTRVEVDLAADAGDTPLRLTPLQPDSGDAPPLTEVELESGDPDRPPVLRLTVPADQPAGHYHGVLLDPSSHQARGTVTVRLSEPPQPETKKTQAKGSKARQGGAKKSGTERKSGTRSSKSSKSSSGSSAKSSKTSGKGGGKR